MPGLCVYCVRMDTHFLAPVWFNSGTGSMSISNSHTLLYSMCFIYRLLFSNSTHIRVKAYSTTLSQSGRNNFWTAHKVCVNPARKQATQHTEKVLGRELIERPDFTIFANRTQTPTQPLFPKIFIFRKARFLNQRLVHFCNNTLKSSDIDRFQRKRGNI